MIKNNLLTIKQIIEAYDDLLSDICYLQDIVAERLDEFEETEADYGKLQEISENLEQLAEDIETPEELTEDI